MGIVEGVARAQQVGASHNSQVQDTHAFFVRLVTNEVEADPLDPVENDKEQPEGDEIEDGERVGEQLSHI